MTKRILAVLLTLAMVLSVCSVNVFAADATTATTTISIYKNQWGWQQGTTSNMDKILEALAGENATCVITTDLTKTELGEYPWVAVGFQSTSDWSILGQLTTSDGVTVAFDADGNAVVTVPAAALLKIAGGSTAVQLFFNPGSMSGVDEEATYTAKVTVTVPAKEEEKDEEDTTEEAPTKKEGRTFGYAIQLSKDLHGFLINGKMIPMSHNYRTGSNCSACNHSAPVEYTPAGK